MDSAIVPESWPSLRCSGRCSGTRRFIICLLSSKGLLTPQQQPSFAQFAAAVSSPSALQRGIYGLLVFVMNLTTSKADLTVSSLWNPNHSGVVNCLWTIIENGTTNPSQRAPHRRQGMPLIGLLSWLPLPALTVSVQRTAPLVPGGLGPGKILVLFCPLENLL